MERIVIIGNSGSGKSYLAQRLSDHYGYPIIHLDSLFWEPGGFNNKRSSESIASLIHDSKLSESWVVEGVFGELAKYYLDDAATLIWLDLPWQVCEARLMQRGSESKRHMSRSQSEQGLKDLVDWAAGYYSRGDQRSHDGHKALFDDFRGTKLWIKDEASVVAQLETILHFRERRESNE